MNGIEKITSRIAADAQEEVDILLREAAERCDAVRQACEKQAGQEEESLLLAGTEKAEQRVVRQERTARLEAKKSVLALKQELVAAAYDKAREKILAMPKEQYTAFLARQADAAVLTGREEIVLNAADRESIGAALLAEVNALAARRGLPGELTLSAEARPISGGLVLRSGNIEVNCTLDTLLEMSRSRLDAEVASVLFD